MLTAHTTTAMESPQRWAAGSPACERRRHGRIAVRDVRCDLGVLVDVSASGMRVRSRTSGMLGRIGELVTTTVDSQVTEPFEVSARVVWARRIGFRRFDAGFEFLGLDADARAGLASLARNAVQYDLS